LPPYLIRSESSIEFDMTADVIITNGHILTMDDANPKAEAIALRGNRIVQVGRRVDIAVFKSSSTRIIDAQGGSVLPGFIEAHMHLFSGAAELDNLDLYSVRGIEQLINALKAYAAQHPEKKLLVANQANYAIISERERLTRHHLDRAVPDRPLICVAPDHHTAWANSAALEAAGIYKGRALPVGNEIVMGKDGLATGELREGEAIKPVYTLKEGGNRDRLGLETGGEPDPTPSAEERAFDRSVVKRGLTMPHPSASQAFRTWMVISISANSSMKSSGRVVSPHGSKCLIISRISCRSPTSRKQASSAGDIIPTGCIRGASRSSSTAFSIHGRR
jgi:predicted amidohydrolase YtcJ